MCESRLLCKAWRLLIGETLFFLLMGLPAHYLDREDVSERQMRLRTIAAAVADVSEQATCSGTFDRADCQAVWPETALNLGTLLIVQAYAESRLARNVHEGNCRDFECDPIRVARTGEVKHRARTLWQIHHIKAVDEEWDRMVGVDFESTRAAAWAATKILSRGYRACGSFAGAISRYAGIDGCRWSEAERRGKLVERLGERGRQWERERAPTREGHASTR